MRLEAMEAAWPQIVYGACAGVSGVATWISAVSDVALQLFGVPLPVVLGAATGAFLARAYLPSHDAAGNPHGFVRALLVSLAWTVAGAMAAPALQSLLPIVPGFGEAKLPPGALAGIAGIMAAAPAWWPVVWPLVRDRVFGKPAGGGTP